MANAEHIRTQRVQIRIAPAVKRMIERARAFYEHFGFIVLPDSATRLFLPMSTFKHLFER